MNYRYGLDQFIFSLTVLIVSSYMLIYNFSWIYLFISFVIYKYTNIYGVGIGLHENFTHKLKKVSLPIYISILAGIGSPTRFYKKHYFHHKYVDTLLDPTSIKRTNILSVITGYWTTQFSLYTDASDIKNILTKPIWIDTYYYIILISIIIFTAYISIDLCIYAILVPIVFNTLDSNILFNWFFHRKGKPVNSKFMGIWYGNKYGGHHAVHHRLFKEL